MDDNGYDPLWDDLPSGAANLVKWFEIAIAAFILTGFVVTAILAIFFGAA